MYKYRNMHTLSFRREVYNFLTRKHSTGVDQNTSLRRGDWMHSFIGLEEKLNLSGVIHSLNVAVDIYFFVKYMLKMQMFIFLIFGIISFNQFSPFPSEWKSGPLLLTISFHVILRMFCFLHLPPREKIRFIVF